MAATPPPLQDVPVAFVAHPGVVDARPILLRSPGNAWERTEQLRSGLYEMVERVCAGRGLEALVLQSFRYVHPAWVKFESWLPINEPTVTARTALTINILTRPSHRYEAVYKVDWEKHGQKGSFGDLYEFDEPALEKLIAFLTAPPARGSVRRRVRRLLLPLQLREKWYQIWKPRNAVLPVRRDWLRTASLALIVIGGLELLVGSLSGGAALLSTNVTPSEPAALELGSLAPGSDPPPVEPAQSGTLANTDPRLNGGQFYDQYTFDAQTGDRMVLIMRSSDFDTVLIVGEIRDGRFFRIETNDDGGNDGTNSRIDFVPTRSGEFVLLCSSLDPGATGAYTFRLQ